MPNGRSPFAGGPLIRRGFEMLANQEEQELAEELRRLRLERARNRERRDEARFRRRFDFRPEGATTIEPTEAAEQPPESVGERPERPPPTVGRGGTVRADRLARSLEGGAASDGTPSTGPGRTIADEMRDLRSTGGAELTPGDVREPEALGRALDMRTVEEPGPATRSAPAAEQPGRIPLSGGGSISRESPEQRRRQEQAQKLRQTLGRVFPEASEAEVELAAMTGDVSQLQQDPEEARERLTETVANVWMEAGTGATARDIQERTGAPLAVIGAARDRIETAQPEFFEEEEGDEADDFLDTAIGGAFRRYVRQNPNGTIRDFEERAGVRVPSRFQSDAFEMLDEQTETRRARDEDLADAFGMSEGPTNRFQRQVLRRAAQQGDFATVRQELQGTLEEGRNRLEETPTPAGPRRQKLQERIDLTRRLLQALQRLEDRAENSSVGSGIRFNQDTGDIIISPNQ